MPDTPCSVQAPTRSPLPSSRTTWSRATRTPTPRQPSSPPTQPAPSTEGDAPVIAFLRRNTVAFIALFLALGGTAYAANTVRSADIVDGTIKTADLANSAVTPAKTTGLWTYHNTAITRTSGCARFA